MIAQNVVPLKICKKIDLDVQLGLKVFSKFSCMFLKAELSEENPVLRHGIIHFYNIWLLKKMYQKPNIVEVSYAMS